MVYTNDEKRGPAVAHATATQKQKKKISLPRHRSFRRARFSPLLCHLGVYHLPCRPRSIPSCRMPVPRHSGSIRNHLRTSMHRASLSARSDPATATALQPCQRSQGAAALYAGAATGTRTACAWLLLQAMQIPWLARKLVLSKTGAMQSPRSQTGDPLLT